MTSANKPSRLAMPQPFASGTGASYTAIENTSGSNVNFVDGFPSAYEAPSSSSGKYVKRGEMNAIGRLASQNNFCDMCGVPNQFDGEVARLIGGYMKGAVLDYVDGLHFYKVISLVDNNKIDYTGTTPTEAQTAAGIVAGTVDGVNWARMNVDEASTDPITLADISLGAVDAITVATVSMNIASGVTSRYGSLCVTPTFGTITAGTGGNPLTTLTLYYTEPGATKQQIIMLSQAGTSGSSAADLVPMKAGTVFSLILAVGNMKYDSLGFKVTLI